MSKALGKVLGGLVISLVAIGFMALVLLNKSFAPADKVFSETVLIIFLLPVLWLVRKGFKELSNVRAFRKFFGDPPKNNHERRLMKDFVNETMKGLAQTFIEWCNKEEQILGNCSSNPDVVKQNRKGLAQTQKTTKLTKYNFWKARDALSYFGFAVKDQVKDYL